MSDLTVVILAAGKGTRMKSALSKVMHPVAGRPMVKIVLETAGTLEPARQVVVIGPDMDAAAQVVAPCPTVVQHDRKGTAHAVAQTRTLLENAKGTVLVLYGDTPLITAGTLKRLVERRRAQDDPAVVVLGFRPTDPGGYGRLKLGADGALLGIIEHAEATEEERAITLCNSGVMAMDGGILFTLLDQVSADNSKGEYYLTDLVALARQAGRSCAHIEGEPDELLGVNSRVELAQAERVLQDRLRLAAMEAGVTLTAPESVFFSQDTCLGQDVVVGPFVTFGPGVTVEDNVIIKGFCHLESCHVATGATVGPYARLRPGARIGARAHIGNFVEIKKAEVEAGAKVNHLSYIGDARVGEGANVGAGTITCNYDGFDKSHTDIGARAFIGSNSALVAPVRIGDDAIIAAGSTIAADVPADSLAINRAPAQVREGWAMKFRRRKGKRSKP